MSVYNLNKTRTLTTTLYGAGLTPPGLALRVVVELCIDGAACSWHIPRSDKAREREREFRKTKDAEP